jgi:hypothetical protein
VADVAWHAGNRYINDHSVGIEMEGHAGDMYTDAQYRAVVAILQWVNGHMHLHMQWTRNTILGDDNVPGATALDPGSGWDWDRFMTLLRKGGAVREGDPRLAAVIQPVAYVWACPDVTCAVLGTATWGEQFHVWVYAPGWIGIDFAGVHGWIPTPDAISGRGAVVRNNTDHPVVVHAEPDPRGRVLGYIPVGGAYASTFVDDNADGRGWWFIEYEHHYGFVCTCDTVRDAGTRTPPAVTSPWLAIRSGYDISYPQRAGPYPQSRASIGAHYQFAIVGVNGGQPFTRNPYFVREYRWVTAHGLVPSFYMNVGFPLRPKHEWLRAPHTCRESDRACQAYDYGYNAASYAYRYAHAPSVRTWWLDIETANKWSANTFLNARLIQGAIEYLQSQGKTVGIYSTPHMWREIAGLYNPGPRVPNWVVDTVGPHEALNFCSSPLFSGGQTLLVQNSNGTYDEDYTC